ncbi:hypothetical protein HML84_18885 [Alcanivorax sp. IO_7]|nr:hypothetical protein HML84_18885 [Alcanivorax sp. IO_7]
MALVVVVVAVFTAGFTARSKPHYVTWRSLEPDVWASIWLIKTHIDPDAKISFFRQAVKSLRASRLVSRKAVTGGIASLRLLKNSFPA